MKVEDSPYQNNQFMAQKKRRALAQKAKPTFPAADPSESSDCIELSAGAKMAMLRAAS
jgi:hypothetical protein